MADDVKDDTEKKKRNNSLKQANILPSGNGEIKASRQRASVACVSCRDRRIRCIVPSGNLECTQCEKAGTACIIRNDDERRRPISKAYTSSLMDRIALLESLLQEKGVDIPPAHHPPKMRPERSLSDIMVTSQGEPSSADQEWQSNSSSGMDGFLMTVPQANHTQQAQTTVAITTPLRHPPVRQYPTKRDELVHKLLGSTRRHLSFDQLSGRVRFFGPTTNCHIFAEDRAGIIESRDTSEQDQRVDTIIQSLTLQTQEYLMSLFWQYYNSVLHVIHESAFEESRRNGDNKYYSRFLHICILAMGYRYADIRRDDMKRITWGVRECTLHREAKYMLGVELERPGGVPSVQAYLLLGDLECGVGRDNAGWMFAGMANRLCFDIGLHLDCKNDGISELEVQIRHLTLLACVVYDRYWALYLGRPTGIKSSDLEMYHLSKQFASLGTCRPAGPEKALETRIYEELADLMELAGKVAEIRDHGFTSAVDGDNVAYRQVLDLDQKMQSWHRRLPDDLTWKTENVHGAPFSFFLLHQQYHCSLILLHRPWARYLEEGVAEPDESGGKSKGAKTVDNTNSMQSRSICTREAVLISRIFWHHRQKFDTRKIFVTGMQHAGTAATALLAALPTTKSPRDRQNYLKYLDCLAGAIQDMAVTFHPAESMSDIMREIMMEFQHAYGKTILSNDSLSLESSTVPTRRDSSTNAKEDQQAYSKRHKAKVNWQAPEYAAPATQMIPNIPVSSHSETTGGFVKTTLDCDSSIWPQYSAAPNALNFPMSTFPVDLNAEAFWIGTESMGPFMNGMGSNIMNGAIHSDGHRQNMDYFSFS